MQVGLFVSNIELATPTKLQMEYQQEGYACQKNNVL